MLSSTTIFTYVVRALALFLCLPIHEAAHAYVSYKMGDPTAKNLGRMSLNPLVHLDLYGSVMMIFLGFGWAKPVPVFTRNFKNTKKGMILSSLAGPAANILFGLVLMIVYKLMFFVPIQTNILTSLQYIVYLLITINCTLAVFNLLPIPPLDGSSILAAVLPAKYYFKIMQYDRYIVIGLMVLLWTGILSGPLYFLRNLLFRLLDLATFFLG